LARGLQILVGDAIGADKTVQPFLARKTSSNVLTLRRRRARWPWMYLLCHRRARRSVDHRAARPGLQ
jgi:hypothetical protein